MFLKINLTSDDVKGNQEKNENGCKYLIKFTLKKNSNIDQ